MAQENELDIDLIDPDPANSRKSLPDLPALAETIKQSGIITPIVVTSNQDRPGRYLVEDGHRRLAAAKLAGLKTVPWTLSERDGVKRELAQYLANEQRSNLTVMETAAKLGRFINEHKVSIEELAASGGRPRKQITHHLALLNLDPKVQEALHRNQLNLSQCLEIARIANKGHTSEAITAAASLKSGDLKRETLRKQAQPDDGSSAPRSTETRSVSPSPRVFERRGSGWGVRLIVESNVVLDQVVEQRLNQLFSNVPKALGLGQ